MRSIEAGDVVRVRTGGPAMRVSSVERRTAVCRWPVFGAGAERNVGLFGVDALIGALEHDPELGTTTR